MSTQVWRPIAVLKGYVVASGTSVFAQVWPGKRHTMIHLGRGFRQLASAVLEDSKLYSSARDLHHLLWGLNKTLGLGQSILPFCT
ncbi:hypothetical protein EI94DRAFT_1754145 [Lactarius quietus]|nr:hypothetical protein EI94DRAFT_1754145 [Lactarius quietus]